MPMATKEAQREYAREWVARRRAEFFADKRCVRCGSTDNLTLDHIDPRLKISHNIWSWSAERRTAEIAKCQVLCVSCHKTKTAFERGYRMRHGAAAMYNVHGCRCDKCRAWKKQKNAATRRRRKERLAGVAQSAERILGMDEALGS